MSILEFSTNPDRKLFGLFQFMDDPFHSTLKQKNNKAENLEERSTAYGFADIIITITGVRMTNWILDIPKPTHQPSVEYEHADVSTADLNKTFLLFIINSRQIIAAI
ncbi:hypothetical protein T01_4964 [Trichinella spiralis]|uniref:Uncharacterized protein n=1 Tax=Trichinella spiralis TaxID=6334 RepID=A0A0V1B4U9_TRISP|nr:hypothetical protein T01_4964 [Trichinella spiralis]